MALPSVQRQFYLAPQDLQWVVSAYALTFGGFLLLGGRASDLFDRKSVFMAGLAIFSLASLAGGAGPGYHHLPGRTRAERPGPLRAVAGVGFGLGVILGGLLTGFLGWRWVFFVNVPIGATAIVTSARILPSSPQSTGQPGLDATGAVLGTGGVLALVAGLTRLVATDGGYGQAARLGALALSLLTAFLAVERRSSDALVPLDVFRLRNLSVANVVAFLNIASPPPWRSSSRSTCGV